LKLFVTSRPELWLTKIIETLEGSNIRHIILQNLNHEDVESYINSRARLLKTSHHEYLKDELIYRSDGNYLWPKLVIDMLDETVFGASLTELTDLYTQKLKGVGLSDNQREEAAEMFRWVILAKRRLTVKDLRYTLAIGIHKASSIENIENSEDIQSLSDTGDRILRYSGGLLEVRSGTVQVIHQSVKEFFLRTDTPFRVHKSIGHTRLAETCVSFLSFPGILDSPDQIDDCRRSMPYSLPRSTRNTPLLVYSFECWEFHLKAGNERDSGLVKAVRNLLWGPKLKLEAISIYMSRFLRQSTEIVEFPFRMLYDRKYFQLSREILSDDLFKDPQNVRNNFLFAAIIYGYGDEVKFCIKSGADVNTQLDNGTYGNALQAAVHHGQLEIKRLLDKKAVDIDAQILEYGNAVQDAPGFGQPEALTEYDINIQGVVHHDQLEIMKVLIENGTDVNAQSGKYSNALQAACSVRYALPEVVKFLVENGADINAQGGKYGNALQAACSAFDDKPEVVRFLVENGADFNAQGGKYGSALQAACSAFFVKPGVVRFLIENGADVNAQGGGYGSALQAAACNVFLESVKLLVENGADVNAQGGKYGNALQAAANHSQLKHMKFLIENGADVNAQGGMYGNA
jgi:ankyrin repeat protein